MTELLKSIFLWLSAVLLVLSTSACDPISDPDPEVYPQSWDLAPHWSWSGDKIAYTSPGIADSIPDRLLFIIDTTGENRKAVAAGAVDAVFLPGDTQLVVMGVDFKLYLLDLNTSSLQLICDCVDARFPEIDPSGQHLYYEDQGVADDWATSIYRMDLATGDTTHILGGSNPSVAPEGHRLVFWRKDAVRCFDLAVDSEWVVFSPGFQAEADWAPDGSEIVIGNITRKGYYGNLYKVKPDGSNARHFSTGIEPQYSPSGNRIAVLRAGRDNRYHLFLIDPDGGNPKQLTF